MPSVLLALFLALWIGGPAWSQEDPASGSRTTYVETRWTQENGLPQNSVNAIVQTRDGFLWCGTNGGLARFDGQRFRVYTPEDSPGLVGVRVLSLLEDSRGDLWIGTHFGGVSRYRDRRFEAVDLENGERVPGVVYDLLEAADGSVWIAARGVHRWDGTRLRSIEGIDRIAHDLAEDRHGVIWAGSQVGLHRVTGEKAELVKSRWVSYVGLDDEGEVWFHGGNYPERPAGNPGRWSANTPKFTDQVRTPDGRVLLAAETGLFEVPGGIAGPTDVEDTLPLRRVSDSAELTVVESLCLDRDGNLWCGTDGQGLFRLQEQPYTRLPLATRGKDIVIPDQAGGLWAASTRLREYLHVDRDGRLECQASPGGGRIYGMAVVGDSLWVRTRRALHEMGENPASFELPVLAGEYGPMVRDRRGRLWIALGRSLGVLDGEIVRRVEDAALTPHELIRSMACLSDGSVWVGSHSDVAILRDGEWTELTEEQGLPHGFVRDIHEASDGTIWLASYGGGLVQVTGRTCRALTTEDGLPDQFLSEILEDDRGRFWVHCNLGLFCISLEQLSSDRAEGAILSCALLRTGEANGPTGALLEDGRIYLPTIHGVHESHTSFLRLRAPGAVEIEKYWAGPTAVALEDGVHLPLDQRRLTFEFTAPEVHDPARLHYRYRLLGRHEHWLETRERVAFYENVPPGDYRFQVVAVNLAGTSSPAETAFTVPAHFHETWTFRALVAAAIAGLAYLVYHIRISEIRRHRNQLADEVQHRAEAEREVRASHDQLRGLTNRLLHAQEDERRRIARELHDDTTHQLVSLSMDLAFLKPQVKSGGEEELKRLVDRTRRMAGQVNQLSRRLHPSTIEELGLRGALQSELADHERRTGLPVRRQLSFGDKEELPAPVATALFRIVQEALRNVHKHGRAASVEVTVTRSQDDVCLEIRDDGVGFDPRAVQGGVGLGLGSMRERAVLLGGTLEVHSAPEKGTRVVARLPLNGDRS